MPTCDNILYYDIPCLTYSEDPRVNNIREFGIYDMDGSPIDLSLAEGIRMHVYKQSSRKGSPVKFSVGDGITIVGNNNEWISIDFGANFSKLKSIDPVGYYDLLIEGVTIGGSTQSIYTVKGKIPVENTLTT